jgi:hypothetical protein
VRASRAALAYVITIGAADGSIIAAVIVTQMPRYQPRPPRSVPGPASIPLIRWAATTQATSAAASSVAATRRGRVSIGAA